jgi:hypothetical protein
MKKIVRGQKGSWSANKFASRRLDWTRYILTLIVALTLALLPRHASSQGSPITVSVSSNQLSTDEVLALTVTLVVDSPLQPQPILPSLDGLSVVNFDIATDVRSVQGNLQTEVVYTYFFQPRRTGLLTIPPIAVEINGQIFESQPISITVTQGAAPAPDPGNAVSPPDDITPPADLNGQDFFVESRVNLTNPYVGQQILHTFRIYQAIQLYREPKYDASPFTEFETRGLPVQQYNLEVAGRTYLITEIRTALFPKRPGQLTIGPGRLLLVGNVYEAPVELYAKPVALEVRALPDNAPPDFKDVVGQYEIKSWFSAPTAVEGQPTTLYVAVSGAGNIEMLPEPVWPEVSGWRGFDALASFTTQMEDDLMTGTRVYERLMVPDQVGNFTFPPISLVYFDPVALEYRTISTAPLPVKVVPQPTPAPTVPAAAPVATPQNISPEVNPTSLVEPLALLNWLEALLSWRLNLPVMGLAFIGLCLAIPMAAIIGAGGVWLWQQKRKAPEPETKRLLRPKRVEPAKRATPGQSRPTIHPALAAAMKETDDNYQAAGQALNAYLSDLLQISVNGLTRTDLAARLRQYSLDEPLITRLETCLAQSEMGRYGPVTPDAGWSLMAATDQLLHELDQTIATY